MPTSRLVPGGSQDVLCEAAVAYVKAGWPVLPLRGPSYEQFVCNRGPSDGASARLWWSDQPYGIGCRTGLLFDVIQVPASLGRPLMTVLKELNTVLVIEVDALAAWWFFVSPGSPVIGDFPRECQVRMLAAGGWVALPPTPCRGGPTSWVAAPPAHTVPWGSLPNSLQMQWAVVRAWNSRRTDATSRVAIDDAGRAEVCRRYRNGATIWRLAADIGRSRKFVRRLLLDANAPLRDQVPTGRAAAKVPDVS